MTHFIEAPMLNANDETVTLVSWLKSNGSAVNRGEQIAVLETTKATFDLEAEHGGYLHTFVPEGASVRIGEVIGALSDTADEIIQRSPAVVVSGSSSAERRVTKK